ncbi:MAG: hypothetical protein ACOC1P_06145 [Minisyncoccales bacterium]
MEKFEYGTKEIEIYIDEIDSAFNLDYLALGVLFINKNHKYEITNNFLNRRCRKPQNQKWNKDPKNCPHLI